MRRFAFVLLPTLVVLVVVGLRSVVERHPIDRSRIDLAKWRDRIEAAVDGGQLAEVLP